MAPALPFIGIKVSDRRLRSACPPHADEAAVLFAQPLLSLRDTSPASTSLHSAQRE